MRVKWLVLTFCLGLVAACSSNPPSARLTHGSLSINSGNEASSYILVNVALPGRVNPSHGPGGKSYPRDPRYQVSVDALSVVADISRLYGLERVEGWPLEALGMYCELMRVKRPGDTGALLAKLQKDPRVSLAQRLNLFEGASEEAAVASVAHHYDDQYFRLQYQDQSRLIYELHRRYQGQGVEIAVIDTGVDIQHPDLQARISLARNFVDNDDKRFLSDVHGTAVAGIIAGEPDNGVGIVGLAPKVKLQVIKACWQDQQTGKALCNSFTLAKALAFALKSRPQVVNLSLSGPHDPLLALLINRLLDSGISVVAARHPHSENNFPANFDGVLSVATRIRDDEDLQAGDEGKRLIYAPGTERLSTAPNERYDFYSGSSIAAAYVSALSALLLEAEPTLSLEQLEQVLTQAKPDPYCIVESALEARVVGGCLEVGIR